MQFEIYRLQCMVYEVPFIKEATHQHNYFQLIWIKKGAGYFTIDMQKNSICENAIYCISPGQMCQFEANNSIEGYYMSVSTEFLYLTYQQQEHSVLTTQYSNSATQIIKPDEEIQKEMDDIMLKMIKEFSADTPLKLEILRGLLNLFIIYLSRGFKIIPDADNLDKDKELVRRFLDLLQKNYISKKLVSKYALMLHVSPNYLNRVVKKISGLPASHHIQQLIVLEAKRQAIYSGLSMKEIAYFLGFNDYAHFSKFFKNNSGVNFTHFKKDHKVNAGIYNSKRVNKIRKLPAQQ